MKSPSVIVYSRPASRKPGAGASGTASCRPPASQAATTQGGDLEQAELEVGSCHLRQRLDLVDSGGGRGYVRTALFSNGAWPSSSASSTLATIRSRSAGLSVGADGVTAGLGDGLSRKWFIVQAVCPCAEGSGPRITSRDGRRPGRLAVGAGAAGLPNSGRWRRRTAAACCPGPQPGVQVRRVMRSLLLSDPVAIRDRACSRRGGRGTPGGGRQVDGQREHTGA
jgi:hypothetical protein